MDFSQVFFCFFCNGFRKSEMRTNRLFFDSGLSLWICERVRNTVVFSEACLPCNSSASLTLLGICNSKRGENKRTNKQNKRQGETLDRFKGADSNPTTQTWRKEKTSLHVWKYFKLKLWCQRKCHLHNPVDAEPFCLFHFHRAWMHVRMQLLHFVTT